MIRSLITFLGLVLAGSAQAIVTEDCPAKIQISLSQYTQLDKPDFSSERDTRSADAAYAYVKKMKSSKRIFDLAKTENSVCTYTNGEVNVDLRGSTKEGALEKASLNVWYSVELSNDILFSYFVSIPVKAVNPEEIELTFPDGYAFVIYYGEICMYGECGPSFERIGKANKVAVKVVK